jgi:hypothetical protein
LQTGSNEPPERAKLSQPSFTKMKKNVVSIKTDVAKIRMRLSLPRIFFCEGDSFLDYIYLEARETLLLSLQNLTLLEYQESRTPSR